MSDYLRKTPAYKREMELVHEHTLHRQLSDEKDAIVRAIQERAQGGSNA